MYNIIFKTYKNNEIQEEGFDTSFAHDLDHALLELDSAFDTTDIDKIELTITKAKQLK